MGIQQAVKKWGMIMTVGAVLGAGVTTPVSAAPRHETKELQVLDSYLPEDIAKHWARNKIYDMIHAGYVNGYTDASGTVTVRPDRKITRAEFVELLVKTLGLKKSPDRESTNFLDVDSSDWYYNSVTIASSLGIVSGTTKSSFGPERYITRGEIAALLVRAFAYTIAFDEGTPRHFKDVGSTYWANREVDKASRVGIISGYNGNVFKPFEYATRAEAMTMLYNALYLEENAVPTDKALLDLIRTIEEEQSRALLAVDTNRLKEIVDTRYTGYYKALQNIEVLLLRKAKEQGYELSITRTGQLTEKVLGKWNRIALVEVDGVKYTLTAKKDGDEWKVVENFKGVAMLKKDPTTNEWRIYTSDIQPFATKPLLEKLGIK